MIEGLIGFLKVQTRGQLVGLILMEIGVFFFIGIVVSQAGISQERIAACVSHLATGEAYSKYGYYTANSLCEAVESGKIKLK